MRFFVFAIIALLSMSTSPKAALDIGVSEPNLEITTGFTGDTLTIFGTAKNGGDVIIIVQGPESDTAIHRKVNVLGLWLTGETITFEDVPGYYNVASSRPVSDIVSPDMRRSMQIGINSLMFTAEDNPEIEKKYRFQEALIQNKQLMNLYSLTPDAVEFMNDSLFRTRIYMPSNVPIGEYEINAFQFQDGELIDSQSQPFRIAQAGLAGDVHDLAYEQPFYYGVLTIIIALFSSLLAITLLRRE